VNVIVRLGEKSIKKGYNRLYDIFSSGAGVQHEYHLEGTGARRSRNTDLNCWVKARRS
jgi:hypothetical protein